MRVLNAMLTSMVSSMGTSSGYRRWTTYLLNRLWLLMVDEEEEEEDPWMEWMGWVVVPVYINDAPISMQMLRRFPCSSLCFLMLALLSSRMCSELQPITMMGILKYSEMNLSSSLIVSLSIAGGDADCATRMPLTSPLCSRMFLKYVNNCLLVLPILSALPLDCMRNSLRNT